MELERILEASPTLILLQKDQRRRIHFKRDMRLLWRML